MKGYDTLCYDVYKRQGGNEWNVIGQICVYMFQIDVYLYSSQVLGGRR